MAKVRNLGIAPAPFTADADYSASQNRYLFVTSSSTADNVQIANGASCPRPIGILQNCPCSGEMASVQMLGFSKLRVHTATSNIGIGSWLTSDASGYGVIEQGVGTCIAGAFAMEAVTGTASAIIEVFVMPFGVSGVAS